MKHVYFILFFLISNQIISQTNWRSTYVDEFTTSPRDLEVLNSEQFLVGGYFFNSNQDKTSFSLLLDAQSGTELKLSVCSTPVLCNSIVDILNVKKHDSGEIFITGNKQFGDAHYLAKLKGTESLEVDWIRDDLDQKDIQQIDDMELVSDGIIIAGQLGGFQYVVMKFDTKGTLVWTYRYTVSEIGKDPIIKTFADGSVLLSYKEGLNDGTEVFQKIDVNGEFVWSLVTPRDVLVLDINNDGDIITVEVFTNDNTTISSLRSYDSDSGAPLAILNSDIGQYYPTQMRINTSNQIFLSGTYSHDLTNQGAIYLEEYNSDGSLKCAQDFFEMGLDDSVLDDVLSDMEIDDKENVILLGRRFITSQANTRSVLVISAKSCSGSSTQSSPETNVSIFPNPTNGVLRFSSDVSVLHVFDMLGRKVLSKKGNIRSLDLTGYKKGFYTIQMLHGQSWISEIVLLSI